MKHVVIWVPDAENELADLWTNASDRQAVTEAANQVDRELEYDPETKGESRGGVQRILLVPPLAVRFLVVPEENQAYVLAVWHFHKRPKST